MVFLGSVKMDKSKRVTLIKEVSEILQVTEKDHLMFYLENGEIVIRKFIEDSPAPGKPSAYPKFWDWYRKRKIEIDTIEDPEVRQEMIKDLEEQRMAIESMMSNDKDGTYTDKEGLKKLEKLKNE